MGKDVIILVNGEHQVFTDAFVRDGYAGGQRVSQVIRQELFQHLLDNSLITQEELMHSSVRTTICVYADVEQMAFSYAQRRSIDWAEDFVSFRQGFEAGLPDHSAAIINTSCQSLRQKDFFIDRMKKSATYYPCVSVILAGVATESMLPLLGDPRTPLAVLAKTSFYTFRYAFQGAKVVKDWRMTLKQLNMLADTVIPPPPPPKLQSTVPRLETVEKIAASEHDWEVSKLTKSPTETHRALCPIKLGDQGRQSGQDYMASKAKRQNTKSTEKGKELADMPAQSPANADAALKENRWRANRWVNARNPRIRRGAMFPMRVQSPYLAHKAQRSTSLVVPQDSQNRRLDPPIGPKNAVLMDSMEKISYCNNFHLKKCCLFDRRSCKYRHEPQDVHTGRYREFTADEMQSQQHLARRSRCRYGTVCKIPACYSGHRCPNHTSMPSGNRCHFSKAMHFEYSEPVNLPANDGRGA